MVQDNSLLPATKGELSAFQHVTYKQFQIIQDQLSLLLKYIGNLPTKEEMDEKIQKSEGHMLTAIEDARHDFLTLHKSHDDRITKVEIVTGLK